MITIQKSFLLAVALLFIPTPSTAARYSHHSHFISTPFLKGVTGLTLGIAGLYGLAALSQKKVIQERLEKAKKACEKKYKNFDESYPKCTVGIQAALSVGALAAAYALLMPR